MEPNLTIVMYHYIRPIADSKWPRVKGLELEDFKGQLDFFQHHYQPITVDQMLSGEIPPKAALITFDDGYADHYQYVFPELKRRKLSGAFFPPARAVLEGKLLDVNKIHFLLASMDNHAILANHIDRIVEISKNLKSLAYYHDTYAKPNRFDTAEIIYIKRMLQVALPPILREKITDELFTRFVTTDEKAFATELYCSPSNLVEMVQNGMTIGGHGYAHNWLDSLTRDEQAQDLDHAMGMLQSIGALKNHFLFCYPYGAYNDDTLDLLKARHCAAAFTTKFGPATITNGADMLQLPRFDTNDLPCTAQYKRKHML